MPPPALGDGCASTVVVVELLPGTRSTVDEDSGAAPILLIETGSTEIQLSAPQSRVTAADVRIVDQLIGALSAYRRALVKHLDRTGVSATNGRDSR